MKNIILYTTLFLLSFGNARAQFSQFSSTEQLPELLIREQGVGGNPNTYSFDPNEVLSGLGYDVEDVDFSCLWSFGDGQYSTEYSPSHTYQEFNQTKYYQVVLYATPIYSPLGPPPAIYIPSSDLIEVEGTPTTTNAPFNDQHEISLTYNRLPRASYESTFILTYRNMTNSPTTFPVEFYYDDNHFEYLGINAPGEEELDNSMSVSSSGNIYNRKLTFSSQVDLEEDEERTIFIQLKAKSSTIGEIVIDGFGNVKIGEAPELHAMAKSYLGTGTLRQDEVEMYAVGSWDPNNKLTSLPYINRDDLNSAQKIRYRINFENVGSGPTSRVQVLDNVSPLLNISTYRYIGDKNNHLNLTRSTDPADRTILFDFNNLSLEGTNSPDNVNLSDCQYWLDIEFDIDMVEFEKTFGSFILCDLGEMIGSFGTNAKIIFDNHNPIYTNTAATEVYCDATRDVLSLSIINIYPNPTQGQIFVSYQVFETLDLIGASLSLIDVNSGVSKNITTPSSLDGSVGFHKIPLDLSNESPGSYILVIQKSNRIFESSIFIKQ